MTPDLFELSLEDLLETEVVTPAAADATQWRAPATIHVVTAEQIRRRGYTHLSELLDDLPGVDFHDRSSASWGNATTVRGLTGNQRLVVFLDGHRFSPPDGDPYAIGPDYALVDAERVEVVLGPSSALYGPDAFMAVVNVITRDGADVDGVRASAAYGQFHTARGELLAGGRIGEATWSVAGSGWHSDEPFLPDAYPDDFAWYTERYLTDGEVLVSPLADDVVRVPIEPWETPGDAHYLHGRLRLRDVDLSIAEHRYAWSTSQNVRPAFARFVEAARWDATVQTVRLQHRLETRDGELRFDSRFLGARHAVDPDSAYVNWVSGYAPAYQFATTLWGAGDVRMGWRPVPWAQGTLGGTVGRLAFLARGPDLPRPFDPTQPASQQDLYYLGTEIEDAEGRDLSVPITFYEGREWRLGPFGEVRLGAEAVAVTAGVRLDYNSRFGRHASPRLGLVFGPDPATTLKLIYGEAILSPSPSASFQHYGSFAPELDAEGDVVGLRSTYFHLANPDLGPERLRTGEVAFGRRFGDTALVGGEAWYGRVDDVISIELLGPTTFAGWPVDAYERSVNRGVASTWGGSLHGDLRTTVGPAILGPRLAWTWTEGRLGDEPMPFVAPHVVEGGLDAALGRFSTSLSGVGRSRAFHSFDADGDRVEVPSHVVLDAFARWDQPVGRGIDVSLTVKATNVLNTRWYRVGDVLPDVFAAAPQDPRRVIVGVEVGR